MVHVEARYKQLKLRIEGNANTQLTRIEELIMEVMSLIEKKKHTGSRDMVPKYKKGMILH